MEIVRERAGDTLHLRVSGRLDNHWSESFDEVVEELIREGIHHLRVDLTAVNYLSSAGVGVLMKAYRDTTALSGTFVISAASERVRTILKLVELESLLFGLEGPATAASPQAAAGKLQSESALFESYPLAGGRAVARLLGDPSRVTQKPDESVSLAVHPQLYALGVGALGASHDECRDLFGEYVAAAGTAAYMPTDGTSTPDYMSASRGLVPELRALYAITFEGTPAHLLRFESSTPAGGVPLGEIVSTCASVAGTDDFGIVIAAEVASLVCALLRRSPAHGDGARLEFPAVREWLSFMPGEFARSSALVVGLVSRNPSPPAQAFLRPAGDGFHGHFHAAVTAFRSLARGQVDVAEVVSQVFQPRSVVSVVHLLRDDRSVEGSGESEFQRGACWVFPLEGGIA